MLTIAVWKWHGTRKYTSEHVNVLARAIKDNITIPCRVVCITDDSAGLDPSIKAIPLPDFEHIAVRRGYPSCYVRLMGFCPEFAKKVGERVLTIDIDVVITGDITPLVDRSEDAVFWTDPDIEGLQYQGGMHLLTSGCRPEVWEQFDWDLSPQETKEAGLLGSDQAWISHMLYPNEVTWGEDSGIYRSRGIKGVIPKDARIIQMSGYAPPWSKVCKIKQSQLYKAWSKYA